MKESIQSFRNRLKTDRGLAFLREEVIYFEHRLNDLKTLKLPIQGEENYQEKMNEYLAKKKDIEEGLDRVFKGIDSISKDVFKDRYPAIKHPDRENMIRRLRNILGDEPLFHTKEQWDQLYYKRDRPEYFVPSGKKDPNVFDPSR